MRNISSIAIALLCAVQSFAQDERKLDWKDVTGTWNGYYTEQGVQKAITFVFTDNMCTVDIPDQGIKAQVFDVRFCQAGDIHISQSGLGKGFSFAGTPNGDILEGKYKLGNVCESKPPGFKVQRTSLARSSDTQ